MMNCRFDAKFIANQINELPNLDLPLSDLNLFQPKGVPIRNPYVDVIGMSACLVPTSKWCCPSDAPMIKGMDKKTLGPFNIPHTILKDQIDVCDIEGRIEYALGLERGYVDITSLLVPRAAQMRYSIEGTLAYREWMAMTRGVVLDADAQTVILDLFAKFGVSQPTVTLDTSLPDYLSLHNWAANLLKMLKYAGKGVAITGAVVAVSTLTFQKIIAQKGFAELWKLCCDQSAKIQGAVIGDGMERQFSVGKVTFREIWEPQYCNPFDESQNIQWAEDGIGYVIPLVGAGVEMYENLIAPRMTLDTIHKAPTDYYDYRDWDRKNMETGDVLGKGFSVEMNVLPIVKRPAMLIKVIVE